MNVRNEIKAQIIRAGMTMQEVVDLQQALHSVIRSLEKASI